MYAALGNIQFSGLNSFSEFSGNRTANYAVIPVISGKPVIQRIGDELEEITLGMLFHRGFCDPDAKLAELESLRVSGEIVPLTTGAGELIGTFVVKTVQRDFDQMHGDGTLWSVRVSVNLLESASDTVAAPVGLAIASLSPRVVPSLTPPITTPALAFAPVTAAASDAAQARRRLQDVATLDVSGADPAAAYAKARRTVDRLIQSINSIASAKPTLSGIVSSCSNVAAGIDAGNYSAALAALDDVERRLTTDVKPAYITEIQNIANRLTP